MWTYSTFYAFAGDVRTACQSTSRSIWGSAHLRVSNKRRCLVELRPIAQWTERWKRTMLHKSRRGCAVYLDRWSANITSWWMLTWRITYRPVHQLQTSAVLRRTISGSHHKKACITNSVDSTLTRYSSLTSRSTQVLWVRSIISALFLTYHWQRYYLEPQRLTTLRWSCNLQVML
jgi:hypothetical protein